MTQNDRPRLTLARSRFEIMLEVIAAAGILSTVVLIALYWSDIPERIPVHFGLDGAPDDWGAKGTIIVFPIIALVLYAGFTALARVPHIYNYPGRITPENAPGQYRLARTLITFLKAVIVWLAPFIAWEQIATALDSNRPSYPFFLPILLILVFGAIVEYMVLARRKR